MLLKNKASRLCDIEEMNRLLFQDNTTGKHSPPVFSNRKGDSRSGGAGMTDQQTLFSFRMAEAQETLADARALLAWTPVGNLFFTTVKGTAAKCNK